MAREQYVSCKLIRETEKAVFVSSAYEVDLYTLNMIEGEFWLPKSQITLYCETVDKKGRRNQVYKVPMWLIRKKNLPTIPKDIIDSVYKNHGK